MFSLKQWDYIKSHASRKEAWFTGLRVYMQACNNQVFWLYRQGSMLLLRWRCKVKCVYVCVCGYPDVCLSVFLYIYLHTTNLCSPFHSGTVHSVHFTPMCFHMEAADCYIVTGGVLKLFHRGCVHGRREVEPQIFLSVVFLLALKVFFAHFSIKLFFLPFILKHFSYSLIVALFLSLFMLHISTQLSSSGFISISSLQFIIILSR